MSLTVPFLPPRLRSDDVGEDGVFMLLLFPLCERAGGVWVTRQLRGAPNMAAPSHLCDPRVTFRDHEENQLKGGLCEWATAHSVLVPFRSPAARQMI